jgi:hypothetical protein
LYAGTETGMYISFDDGTSWKPFQLNLPIVPITDLTIKNDNLIAATQGRSFWLIDDLTPLHQLSDEVTNSNYYLYKPMPAYRMGSGFGFGRGSRTAGKNHPGGVMIHYYVKDTAKIVASLEIMDNTGKLIKKFATKPDKKAKEEQMPKIIEGMNRFVWNMRYPDAEGFDGLIMWAGGLIGPRAVPGSYKAKLTVNGKSSETAFEILKDPRTTGTLADIKEQFDFQMQVGTKLTETHKAIKKIRSAREQINRAMEPMKGKDEMKEITELSKTILADMKKIEEALYQTKNRSGQDPLNFPVRLNNKLAALNSESSSSDFKPNAQTQAVYTEIVALIDVQLNSLKKIFDEQIPKLNDLVKTKQIDAIQFVD